MARYEKVAESLKKEISYIIRDELRDPRLGFITITHVELTQDMRYAKVFFSVLGKDEDYKKTKEALDSALGFIRRLVAQRINLRFAPEIAFKEDRSCEYSIKIQEILDQISPVTNTKALKDRRKISHGVKEFNESHPSSGERAGGKRRKEGRGEPKKSSRVHKKK